MVLFSIFNKVNLKYSGLISSVKYNVNFEFYTWTHNYHYLAR